MTEKLKDDTIQSSVKSEDLDQIEQLQSVKRRFSIILVLLLTAIIIGFPAWYLTTSVERSKLPIEEIDLLNQLYLNNVNYEIPVEIIDLPITLNGLIEETQELLNSKLSKSNTKIKLLKENNLEIEDLNIYKLKLIMNEDEDKLIVSPNKDKLIRLFITPNVIKNGLVGDLISRVLTDSIFNLEINESLNKQKNIIKFPFTNDYKISINFLHSGNKILDLNDDNELIKKALNNFQNFIQSLKSFANFTIEFQELWYEKRILTNDEYKVDNKTIIKDTSMFIDYSDWGLDQDVELNPIINLNLYLPDNEKIIIENSIKNSFIIPQWGGVIISNDDEKIDYNKLNEIFDIFAFQILKLIGINTDSDKSLFYRIDEMIRIQTVENIKESLKNFQSLIKLSNQLETIPIPLETVEEIKESIEKVHLSINKLQQLNWLDAYKSSIIALKLSNNAFFHKDMVQQAYFPEEHKMAVYSPLLGPFATISILALIRGIKEMKKLN
jgi:phosphatidylinositol glycan class S